MDKINVQFSNVEDVSRFVNILSKYDGDFDLYCGSYCVDARSILGIMTMDLKNEMFMTTNCDSKDKVRLVNELSSLEVAVA